MSDGLGMDMENGNPIPATKNFGSLTIAVIVSKRLFYYLDSEANVLLLDKLNYQYVLKYLDVDFLLVESAFQFYISDFDYSLISSDEKWNNVKSILDFARKMSIPTIYWQTNYFLFDDKITKNFDFVYTAFDDKKFLTEERFRHLPHATQPKIYHPYRFFGNQKQIDQNIVIENSNIIHSHSPLNKLFSELQYSTLKFIDTGMSESLDPRSFSVFDGRSFVKNCTETYRTTLLRNSIGAISYSIPPEYSEFNIISDLEKLAMGVPVMYFGKLGNHDVRKNIVLEVENLEDLENKISELHNPLYRERASQLCFRKVVEKHTISHRFNQICKDIGLSYQWTEYPAVSLCFATHRMQKISNCIETFKRQTYPNKQLIIAFNGPEKISREELHFLKDPKEPIHFIQSSRERLLGGALNSALNVAEGVYFFKMDDDDHYGDHYIHDLVLAARLFDVDVFGKPRDNFFQFEHDNELFKRKDKYGNRYYATTENLRDLDVEFPQIITGNSIAGKTKFLKKVAFPENCPRHTDTLFFKKLLTENVQGKLLIADSFNMIQIRYRNENWHTWQIDEESLKSRCEGGFDFGDAIV